MRGDVWHARSSALSMQDAFLHSCVTLCCIVVCSQGPPIHCARRLRTGPRNKTVPPLHIHISHIQHKRIHALIIPHTATINVLSSMNPHRQVAFNLRSTGGEGETQGCGAFVAIELQDEVQSDGGVASSSIYPQTPNICCYDRSH